MGGGGKEGEAKKEREREGESRERKKEEVVSIRESGYGSGGALMYSSLSTAHSLHRPSRTAGELTRRTKNAPKLLLATGASPRAHPGPYLVHG